MTFAFYLLPSKPSPVLRRYLKSEGFPKIWSWTRFLEIGGSCLLLFLKCVRSPIMYASSARYAFWIDPFSSCLRNTSTSFAIEFISSPADMFGAAKERCDHSAHPIYPSHHQPDRLAVFSGFNSGCRRRWVARFPQFLDDDQHNQKRDNGSCQI